jgi:hypothetical protein
MGKIFKRLVPLPQFYSSLCSNLLRSKMGGGVSTVVEHSPHHHKVKGSSPATVVGSEREEK